MKTWISIIICFLLSSGLTIKAQQLLLSAISEATVAGPQFGGALGFDFKRQTGVGVFYQTELNRDPETNISNNLSGLFLQVPLVKSEKLVFLARGRLGLSNNKYIVAIPGLETRVHITRHVGVAFEMSMRMNYPALSGKIYTTIF